MPSLSRHRALALGVALALTANPLIGSAAPGDTAGDLIIGQPDASSGEPNVTGVDASGLDYPYGAAFDAAGNLFVADADNNRVLGYRAPMTTDAVADLVIGQPDFNSNAENNGGVSAASLHYPVGVAVSAAGDLYVADIGNDRVLEYDRPFATDTVADRVFGQPDLASNTANNGGLGPASLDGPLGIAVDAAGNLWVADAYNHRVLQYDNPVAASDQIADLVLGQPDFTTNTPNFGGVSAASLRLPTGVAVDAQRNVWVADSNNHRVLEYDDPKTFGATADRALGQPSFTSDVPNYTGAVSAAGLKYPFALSVAPDGNVYVCDSNNHRVLLYTSPTATRDRIADRVFGQPDFTSGVSNNGGISAQTLSGPSWVAIDPTGNLAIADVNNNRIVLLKAPVPLVTSLELKVSPRTGKAKFIVRGFGIIAGRALVEVDGVALATTRYKQVAADGSSRRLIASDPSFDAAVPPGVPVSVAVFDPLTGSRSAPRTFTR
jgi:sugar lactone lactonase YvrE